MTSFHLLGPIRAGYRGQFVPRPRITRGHLNSNLMADDKAELSNHVSVCGVNRKLDVFYPTGVTLFASVASVLLRKTWL